MKLRHKIAIGAVAVAGSFAMAIGLSSLPVPSGLDCSQGDLAILDYLWQHVYHPQRLKVVEQCRVVSGTVFSVASEADGDYHIRLSADPQYQNLINAFNVSKQQGKLVLEPICQNTATQEDAVNSCKNFFGHIYIPKIGERIKAIGSYIYDLEHGGWSEIHPVLFIVKL